MNGLEEMYDLIINIVFDDALDELEASSLQLSLQFCVYYIKAFSKFNKSPTMRDTVYNLYLRRTKTSNRYFLEILTDIFSLKPGGGRGINSKLKKVLKNF